MELISEKPAPPQIDLEFEMTQKEKETLLKYAQDNCPIEVIDKMLMSWAITNILTNELDRIESLNNEELS